MDIVRGAKLEKGPGGRIALSAVPQMTPLQGGIPIIHDGIVIGGTQPKRVVIRARGPSLTPLGVPGAMATSAATTQKIAL